MRQLTSLLLLTILLPLFSAQASGQTSRPPAAPINVVTDNYYGNLVPDPYRSMEDVKSPATLQWMHAQTDFTRTTLDDLGGREAMLAEIDKYQNGAPAKVSDVRRLPGELYFFEKTPADGNVPQIFMRRGLGGQDQLLVDTNRFAGPHGEPPMINYYEASSDGHYVAFGVSAGGSEAAVIHITDVQSGKDLPETIDRAEFGGVQWRPDNQSFFYTRLQKLASGAPEIAKFDKAGSYLHILGTSPDADVEVMGFGLSKLVPMKPMDSAGLIIKPDSDWAVGIVGHGVLVEETLYCAPLASLTGPEVPWRKICDVDDGVADFSFRGDDIYLLTHNDAPRYKVIRTSLSHPDLANAQTIIPQQKEVLRGIHAPADGLYVQELDGAINHILRVPWGGKPQRIAMPFDGGVDVESDDHHIAGAVLRMTSWTKGSRVAIYDPASDKVIPTDLQPTGPFDNLDEITSVEVHAPGYDGTPIPLSIISKKGVVLNSDNPTIVWAYGGYGITHDSSFDPADIAWVEHGGVYCIAHVRGGGEGGEDWHLAARKLTKPNVWRDLIACCQYMIAQKYTTPARLAITGGSNGGITVGRAITERPDLFAAAQCRAGVFNTLRMELEPNGPPNVPEYGDVNTQEGFEDLYTMDSYQHVKDGVAYPSVLITTGINDPRVSPAEPAKMAARLQAATSSGNPVLLNVDFQGGHILAAMSKKQLDGFYADMYSFFLWRMGDNAFLPKSLAMFHPDIEYENVGGVSVKLDACVPAAVPPPSGFPIAILVHGGGWHSGEKQREFPVMPQPLTDAHFTWFSIDYRLSPTYQWPACYEDMKAAIRWVKAHAAEFKGDPNRIALIGYSAGGELVTLAAARADDSTRVQAVVAFAPPTDMEADTAVRKGMSANLQRLVGASVVDDHAHAVMRDMSPIDFLHPGLPPFLLVQGNADKGVMYSQTQVFAAKLKSLNVPCEFITIDQGPHDVLKWEGLSPGYRGKVVKWLRKRLED